MENVPSRGKDNPDLVAAVTAKLAALPGSELAGEPAAPTSKDTNPPQETSTEVVVEEPGAEADSAPTLPDNIRRSLYSYRWKDEQIDAAMERDPATFMATATMLHESRVAQTQEWAAIGQKRREVEAADDDAPDLAAAITATPGGGVSINYEALADASGFDVESLRKAFGPVATTIDTLNKVLPQLQEQATAVQEYRARQEQDNAYRLVTTFFGSDPLKPYTEFYGAGWDNVSEEQLGRRNKVVEMADHIIVGASQHGRDISEADALELAHGVVAADYTTTKVRKEIASSVKKRAAGVSLRPSSQTAPPAEGLSRAELLARTGTRLATLFS